MSRFIKEFENVLRAENSAREVKLSGSKVFEIAGLDRSTLSRIRAGLENIKIADIPRVAAAMTTDEMGFSRLVRARLQDALDDLKDPRTERILIEITGASAQNKTHNSFHDFPTLPPKLESAFHNMLNSLDDAGIRAHIKWFGNHICAPSSSSEPHLQKIVSAAVADARAATKQLQKPTPPVTYRIARESKRKKPSARPE